MSELTLLLDQKSVLGGAMIEGVVLKSVNGELFDADRKTAKLVSQRFREINNGPKVRMPGDDPFTAVAMTYRTRARWFKAIQYLRDNGNLTDTNKDIPRLIQRVREDTLEEDGEDITNRVMQAAWPKINRELVSGLGDWYIQYLSGDLAAIENLYYPEEASVAVS